MIYYKKYIWSSYPFLGHRPQNSEDGVWWPVEPTTYIEGWDFQSHPRPSEKKEGLEVKQLTMASDIISRGYIKKLQKTPNGQGLERFQVS